MAGISNCASRDPRSDKRFVRRRFGSIIIGGDPTPLHAGRLSTGPNRSGLIRAIGRIKPGPAYLQGMQEWSERIGRELKRKWQESGVAGDGPVPDYQPSLAVAVTPAVSLGDLRAATPRNVNAIPPPT